MSIAKLPSSTLTTNTTDKQLTAIQPPTVSTKEPGTTEASSPDTNEDDEQDNEKAEEDEDSVKSEDDNVDLLTEALNAALVTPGERGQPALPDAATVNELAQISALTAAISPIQQTFIPMPVNNPAVAALPVSSVGEAVGHHQVIQVLPPGAQIYSSDLSQVIQVQQPIQLLQVTGVSGMAPVYLPAQSVPATGGAIKISSALEEEQTPKEQIEDTQSHNSVNSSSEKMDKESPKSDLIDQNLDIGSETMPPLGDLEESNQTSPPSITQDQPSEHPIVTDQLMTDENSARNQDNLANSGQEQPPKSPTPFDFGIPVQSQGSDSQPKLPSPYNQISEDSQNVDRPPSRTSENPAPILEVPCLPSGSKEYASDEQMNELPVNLVDSEKITMDSCLESQPTGEDTVKDGLDETLRESNQDESPHSLEVQRDSEAQKDKPTESNFEDESKPTKLDVEEFSKNSSDETLQESTQNDSPEPLEAAAPETQNLEQTETIFKDESKPCGMDDEFTDDVSDETLQESTQNDPLHSTLEAVALEDQNDESIEANFEDESKPCGMDIEEAIVTESRLFDESSTVCDIDRDSIKSQITDQERPIRASLDVDKQLDMESMADENITQSDSFQHLADVPESAFSMDVDSNPNANPSQIAMEDSGDIPERTEEPQILESELQEEHHVELSEEDSVYEPLEEIGVPSGPVEAILSEAQHPKSPQSSVESQSSQSASHSLPGDLTAQPPVTQLSVECTFEEPGSVQSSIPSIVPCDNASIQPDPIVPPLVTFEPANNSPEESRESFNPQDEDAQSSYPHSNASVAEVNEDVNTEVGGLVDYEYTDSSASESVNLP